MKRKEVLDTTNCITRHNEYNLLPEMELWDSIRKGANVIDSREPSHLAAESELVSRPFWLPDPADGAACLAAGQAAAGSSAHIDAIADSLLIAVEYL